MCFQEVPDHRPGKRRLHLDIAVPDRPTEIRRLVSFGATVVEVFEHHTWLRDPEGNDFCLTDLVADR